MTRHTMTKWVITASLAAMPLAACEELPGEEEEQGAVIGGAAGAAAGAAIYEENRLLGALIGGLLGAGGGYLIGSNMDHLQDEDQEAAREAVEEAQRDPATADDVHDAATADLNEDGFVTLDEVVAMESAGLTDQDMLDRLEATNQVFELTPEQEQYLIDRGVSRYVVNRMENLNREIRDQLIADQLGASTTQSTTQTYTTDPTRSTSTTTGGTLVEQVVGRSQDR